VSAETYDPPLRVVPGNEVTKEGFARAFYLRGTESCGLHRVLQDDVPATLHRPMGTGPAAQTCSGHRQWRRPCLGRQTVQQRRRPGPPGRRGAHRSGRVVCATGCRGRSPCRQVRRQRDRRGGQGGVDRHQVSAWPLWHHRHSDHRKPQPHRNRDCTDRRGRRRAPDDGPCRP